VRAVAEASGHTPAQVALNWVGLRRGVTAPIVGVRTVAQLEENLGAVEVRLEAGLRARLDDACPLPDAHPYDLLAATDGIIRNRRIES
jgi:aryl-alcohol dehydrogenase-like predicted oxidoreductase